MMQTRRGFLGAILAAGYAPAAIGSGVLMPIRQLSAPVPIFRGLPGNWDSIIPNECWNDHWSAGYTKRAHAQFADYVRRQQDAILFEALSRLPRSA